MFHRNFRPDGKGRFRPRLSPEERDILRSLPLQARDLLVQDDPLTGRLFPVAYPGDPAAQEDYRNLMGSELLGSHQAALDTMAATIDAETIDEEDLRAWLGGLEILRLVLGTQLDVTEEMDPFPPNDPRAMHQAVYGYLSSLQNEVVDALATLLPDGGTDD